MSFILILATAAATMTEDFRIYLTGSKIADYGIEVSAQNVNYEFEDPPSPAYFSVGMSETKDCDVVAVGIQVENSTGEVIFGTTISNGANQTYAFRLEREHIDTASIAVRCNSGPEQIDRVYIFNLSEALKAP